MMLETSVEILYSAVIAPRQTVRAVAAPQLFGEALASLLMTTALFLMECAIGCALLGRQVSLRAVYTWGLFGFVTWKACRSRTLPSWSKPHASSATFAARGS